YASEQQTVCERADDYDQQHHRHYLVDVIQVTTGGEELPEPQADEDHLSGNERAPGKGPTLLQAGHKMGQAGGKKNVQKQVDPGRAEISAGHEINPGNIAQPGFHRNRYSQQRADDYHKYDGLLGETKPQDRNWKPAHAGKTLDAYHQAAQGLGEKSALRQHDTQKDAHDAGEEIPDYHALQAHRHAGPEGMVGKAGAQSLNDIPRRGEKIGLPKLQHGHDLPQTDQSDIEPELSDDLIHGGTQRGPICRFPRAGVAKSFWR